MTTYAQSSQSIGVHLRGLVKSFSSPAGTVHAVRGVDVAIAPGETVALLGPNGAGKSTTIDMLLGLARPDSGTVSLFGMPPADAIKAGAIGAMLQTGSLIRDLSVRELITMMASVYSQPLGVDEVLELTGITDIAGRRTQKLSGGQTQRTRLRHRARVQPGPAGARRAHGGDGRREPARLLDVDARLRRLAARPWSSPPTTWKRPTPTPTGSC